MRLNVEAQQALKSALKLCEWITETPHQSGSINGLAAQVEHAVRAALAEEAMQRLTDEQQEIEAVTDCHDLNQARAAVVANLLAHFGINSANSDVNLAYLHKQLDDFLAASIGCNREGDELAPPLKQGEKCDYPWCLSSNGCERQCPAFPRCEDSGTGKKSDAPETNFGNMVQAVDCYGDGNVYRGQRTSDSKSQTLIVKETSPPPYDRPADAGKTSDHFLGAAKMAPPVAYVNDEGWFRSAEDADAAFRATAQPLYAAPPKREPMTDAEINGLELPASGTATIRDMVRLIERAHGIGGEK